MSSIEWTDETWNPVTGCDRCSPGCDNCYIERTVPFRIEGRRFDEHGRMGIRLHPDRLDKPLHWRKPRRVFVNSLSDLFHRDVPEDFIAQVFASMSLAGQHTYQVLTKRPQRMVDVLTDRAFVSRMDDHRGAAAGDFVWPLPNVWLGVSVENQRYADLRIPYLLATPAAVRFLSCEPLLGPVTLAERWLVPEASVCNRGQVVTDEDRRAIVDILKAAGRRLGWVGVDWVIVGGESGSRARPMHRSWARGLRDQCRAAGVPFFYKQHGEWASYTDGELHADELTNGHVETTLTVDGEVLGPDELCDPEREPSLLLRVRKNKAGRELDGRTWDETPHHPGNPQASTETIAP